MIYKFCKSGKIIGRDGELAELVSPNGYSVVNLSGKWQTRHRAIWQHFNGQISKNLQINHKNGIKTDNRLCNLELVTPSENLKHAHRLGLIDQKGIKNPAAKLTLSQVKELRIFYDKNPKFWADRFQVSKGTIFNVVNGRCYVEA